MTMKNFYKVTDVNVKDVMDSLNAHPELWGHRLPIRTAFPNSPQREADDIIFRFNDLSQHITQDTLPQIFDDIKCVWFPPVLVMPIINVLSLFIMQAVHGEELGRVMITKLPPGGVIHPHVDEGGYAFNIDFSIGNFIETQYFLNQLLVAFILADYHNLMSFKIGQGF